MRINNLYLVFFYNMYFQKQEINFIHKVILIESCLCMSFEFFYITFKPDRL